MFSKPMNVSVVFRKNSENVSIIDSISANQAIGASTINQPVKSVTVVDYMKILPNFAKMKIPELKSIAKFNKLHVTGTKPVLIQRLTEYYKKCSFAIKIQKMIRGNFVRLSFRLRGAGFKDHSICTNTSDFLTMEPLNEIPHSQFFSYTDNNNFTYGFDLNSLVTTYKKKGRLVNPYNRERLSFKEHSAVLGLYSIATFLYKDYDYGDDFTQPIPAPTNRITGHHTHSLVTQHFDASNNIITIHPTNINLPNNQPSAPPYPTNASASVVNQPSPGQSVHNMYNNSPVIATVTRDSSVTIQSNIMTDLQLNQIRTRSINDRITAVFMDMDQLGHYTNSEWFRDLDKRQYYNFFREIYNLWRFRAQMSFFTKNRICRFDPVSIAAFQAPLNYDETTIDIFRDGCLLIIENMVYMGVDTDHRNLGAFHILTALTCVSLPARQALPWLYESVR